MKHDWETIYRDTYQDLVRFLHRNVWDPDRAQDLAQDVFVRALRSDPDDPKRWLFTVALNLARDEARTHTRRKRHLVLLKTEKELEREEQPAAADEDNSEKLREALEQLSESDREVLLLWDAGLNYKEIAEQTSLSSGSVGTTLSRARKRLVSAFKAEESEVATS